MRWQRAAMMELGSYQIIKRLAIGGMAEIFLARHRSAEGFQRYLVIKRILPEFSNDAEFVEGFLNEAKLSAQLNHPNIVRLFELGCIGQQYFIVMEYLRGFDLLTLVQLCRRLRTHLPIGVALRIFSDVCAGLDYAHHATDLDANPLGIVHRDVTASNIMVSQEGVSKLLDFGIAKATNKADNKTRVGAIKGKLAYLAPEQVRGMAIDHRVDVFAAGVMLYELLTNFNPFRGENEYATLHNIVSMDPRPVHMTRADVPQKLSALIMKALQRDPARRFQTCGEMRLAAEEIACEHDWTLSHSEVRAYLNQHQAELAYTQAESLQGTGSSDIEGKILRVGTTTKTIARPDGIIAEIKVAEVVQKTDEIEEVALEDPIAFEPAQRWFRPVAIAGAASLLIVVGLMAVMGAQAKGPPAQGSAAAEHTLATSVEVVTDPLGAEVLISNPERAGMTLLTGATPLCIDDLELGWSYDIEVRRAGYRTARSTLKLDKPGTTTMNIKLLPGDPTDDEKLRALR